MRGALEKLGGRIYKTYRSYEMAVPGVTRARLLHLRNFWGSARRLRRVQAVDLRRRRVLADRRPPGRVVPLANVAGAQTPPVRLQDRRAPASRRPERRADRT